MLRIIPSVYEIPLGAGLFVNSDLQIEVDFDMGTINEWDFGTFAFPENDGDYLTFFSTTTDQDFGAINASDFATFAFPMNVADYGTFSTPAGTNDYGVF